MTMDKQTNIPLETTAKYQPLSNLDVNFYTRDIQTSILNFIVTRNHKPLLLGESNVVTNISLEFEDGSIVRDDLTIKDGINGILSYTLSDEMLRHTGKVTGQVDIAIKGKEDTVVERLFSFNISKTLIDSIDAETKLIHIKRFSDLEKNITERYERMEETFANGESLAQAVLDASTKGLDELTSAKTKSLNEIKTSKDSTLKEITNTGSDYTNQLNTVYNTIDEKINKFNTDVQAGGYVKSSITDNWQKYKLTNNDGSSKELMKADLLNNEYLNGLEPGSYFASESVSTPSGTDGFVNVQKRNVIKIVYFQPQNSDKLYINRFNNVWSNWYDPLNDKESISGSQAKADKALSDAKVYVDKNISDTGWQELPLMSGVEADTDLGPSVYRVKNGVCNIIFNVRMTAAKAETSFLTLPSNVLPKYAFSFLARTDGNSGKNPVKCSYDVINKVFKIWQNNDNTINTGDFVYGQLTYIVG
ncbi:BppU family phage baseplate upper protein [Staphylococcus sp. GDY8P67P]|uniref:BppU family phage baseplate upper protein n=1 Tax=Staphylococcus sp. GDY8P67P TaxID=2804131 RepID=UPI001AEC221C|nr:BppU family phage baseplate upper protein [Staphylococcus sp. GDY8P67P]